MLGAPVPVYPFVACEVDHPATVERRCTPYQLGVYTNLSVTGEPTEFWDCPLCTRVNNAQQDKCACSINECTASFSQDPHIETQWQA